MKERDPYELCSRFKKKKEPLSVDKICIVKKDAGATLDVKVNSG